MITPDPLNVNEEKLQLEYADHIIRLHGEFEPGFARDYLWEMADELSLDGSIQEHMDELEKINNDGSWILESK